jgi:hypothetical protein
MIFKTMPREVILKALEGQEDVLTPALREHQQYFRNLSCPRCQSSVIPVVDPKRLFRENGLLPNYLAKCSACECVFEPYTKIEVELPKKAPDSSTDQVDLFPIGPRSDL